MSELAQAVQEADAMEDALAAPLFNSVRADVEAVLDGRGGDADSSYSSLHLLSVLHDALPPRFQAQAEAHLDTIESRLKALAAERDEARHAKAQMELRWQAAEKECATLRAQLEQAKRFTRYPVTERLNEIRDCQATHPGQNWCEKCR